MLPLRPTPSDARLPPGHEATPVLSLLLPIKQTRDVIYGARYAKRLREWGIAVKVSLLHVTQTSRDGHSAPDEREAEEVLREATLYLSRCQVEHRTFVLTGDVVFSILDTAEQLDCHEIVLPEAQTSPWPRLFSSNIVRQIVRASRTATVVLADPNGIARSGACQ